MKLIKDLGNVEYKWDEKRNYMRHRHMGIFECPICHQHYTLQYNEGLRGKTCNKCKGKTLEQHGMSRTPIYHVWCSMKQRCFNSKSQRYHRYGGRGITVCERWLSFENFYEDNKDLYKEGLTIDRIDGNGNYEPGNVQWIPLIDNSLKREKTDMISVNQYELIKVRNHYFKINPEPIAKFESITAASKATGINLQHIADVVAGNRKSAGKYYWRMSNSKKRLPEEIFVRESRPIKQYLIIKNEDGTEILQYLKTWDTAYQAEASDPKNIKHTNIAKVCNGKRKSHAGCFWEYA